MLSHVDAAFETFFIMRALCSKGKIFSW